MKGAKDINQGSVFTQDRPREKDKGGGRWALLGLWNPWGDVFYLIEGVSSCPFPHVKQIVCSADESAVFTKLQLADGLFMFKPPHHQMLSGERTSPNQWTPPTALYWVESIHSMLLNVVHNSVIYLGSHVAQATLKLNLTAGFWTLLASTLLPHWLLTPSFVLWRSTNHGVSCRLSRHSTWASPGCLLAPFAYVQLDVKLQQAMPWIIATHCLKQAVHINYSTRLDFKWLEFYLTFVFRGVRFKVKLISL